MLYVLGYFYAQRYPGLNPFFGSRGQNSANQDQPYSVYLQGLLQGDLGRVDLVPIAELLVEPLLCVLCNFSSLELEDPQVNKLSTLGGLGYNLN